MKVLLGQLVDRPVVKLFFGLLLTPYLITFRDGHKNLSSLHRTGLRRKISCGLGGHLVYLLKRLSR